MKKSYVFLADGFEEIEALATVDVLRRSGMNVETISVTDIYGAGGAHEVMVSTDDVISEVDLEAADWLICPGGMPGASNLAACKTLTDALVKHHERGGHIAAICAAPAVVLAPLGILRGKRATCYPSFELALEQNGATHVADRVVVDGNVVTGNGPSSAIAFALAIVAQAQGQAAADQVAAGMLV